jgi:hypothetical protein
MKPVQIKTACSQPEKVVLSGVRRLVAALHSVRLIYAQTSIKSGCLSKRRRRQLSGWRLLLFSMKVSA